MRKQFIKNIKFLPRIILTLALFFGFTSFSLIDFTANSYTDKKGVVFSNQKFTKVLKEAQGSNKVIFLIATSENCHPCREIMGATLQKSRMGDYFNEEFENFKLNIEGNSEEKELTKKYRINQVPTLLFLDNKGKVLLKSVGYKSSNELLKLSKSLKTRKS